MKKMPGLLSIQDVILPTMFFPMYIFKVFVPQGGMNKHKT